jgi:phosphoribosylformylglycinamidine cyclo-ligase
MAAVVPQEAVTVALAALAERGVDAWVMGEIEARQDGGDAGGAGGAGDASAAVTLGGDHRGD